MTPGSTPQSPEAMQAVILERVDSLKADMGEIKAALAQHPEAYVSRHEWRVWADARDREIKELREASKTAASAAAAAAETARSAVALAEEQREDRRRRPNWATVGGFALAALMGIVTLINSIAGG